MKNCSKSKGIIEKEEAIKWGNFVRLSECCYLMKGILAFFYFKKYFHLSSAFSFLKRERKIKISRSDMKNVLMRKSHPQKGVKNSISVHFGLSELLSWRVERWKNARRKKELITHSSNMCSSSNVTHL
jgi:hypothetical protein